MHKQPSLLSIQLVQLRKMSLCDIFSMFILSLTELECSLSGRRFLTVDCEVFNADISELYCFFDDIPGAEEEICELYMYKYCVCQYYPYIWFELPTSPHLYLCNYSYSLGVSFFGVPI